MTALTIASGIFGLLCIGTGVIVGAVGFAFTSENDELVGGLVLGIIALLLVGSGLHFLHIVPW